MSRILLLEDDTMIASPFQYGSINTFAHAFDAAWEIIFTFQYGSINTSLQRQRNTVIP